MWIRRAAQVERLVTAAGEFPDDAPQQFSAQAMSFHGGKERQDHDFSRASIAKAVAHERPMLLGGEPDKSA